MTTEAGDEFQSAYESWIALHELNGFAVGHFLNRPASEEQITALEQDIGFVLPGDLKALWARADGQRDTIEIEDPAPGTIVSPFFGQYDFLSVAGAEREYRLWREVHDDAGDTFASTFNGIITRRGDDPVHRDYWRPGWLPFARDGGGNAYAVDLSPAEGGMYGQVILIGPDEDERRVLAPGIAPWLTAVAARHPAPDDSATEPPLVYFDMEG